MITIIVTYPFAGKNTTKKNWTKLTKGHFKF